MVIGHESFHMATKGLIFCYKDLKKSYTHAQKIYMSEIYSLH